MDGKKGCQNCYLGLLSSNGCHRTGAVWFASPPFLRVMVQLDTISLVPHYIISGFGQSTESKGSPEFPNSFLSLHIIIGCLGASQGWEILSSLQCSNLLVQCLAPGQRPMELRLELSCSSLRSSFSNGRTARRRALRCLGIPDGSQQQKWVTESVL